MVLIVVCDWSTGHPLLPDFFLDDAPETLVEQMEQHGKYYRYYVSCKYFYSCL